MRQASLSTSIAKGHSARAGPSGPGSRRGEAATEESLMPQTTRGRRNQTAGGSSSPLGGTKADAHAKYRMSALRLKACPSRVT